MHWTGSHIGFAGATYTDRPNFQILTSPLPLFWHKTDTRLRAMAARHLGALKSAICSLHEYYKHELPTLNALDPTNRPNPCFPHRTEYTSLVTKTTCSFKYVSQESAKLVFFGKTDDDEPICIKFVRSYSKDAHAICELMGFAPKLKGFQVVPGGWQMVIMDVVGDGFVHFDQLPHEPRHRVKDEIKDKLIALHQAGYVHGDIRDTNVMVKKSDTMDIMLIDFDWAGEIGKVRYPMNVNIGPLLPRPDGAFDGELIKPEHDIDMLDMM